MGRDWQPQRPVVLIAGTPPGGGQDRAARALAGSLAPLLDVAVEVINIPGRGGGNGWDRLARSPREPHLLSISSPTLITNRLVGAATIDYRNLTSLAVLCTEYIAFAVATGSSIADGLDLMGRLGSKAGPIAAFATAVGNVNHVALARLAVQGGTDPSSLHTRVFDSAPEAVRDLLDGNSQLAAVSAASLVTELERGTVRVLAVSSPVRLGGSMSAVPTWEELAVPCTIGTWRGVVAPPDLAPVQIRGWESAISAAVSGAAWRAALERHIWTPTVLGAAATDSFHHQQAALLSDALYRLGLLPEGHG